MFKAVRWRTEKNKITALFKLQFNATQVSQLGGHALVLSLIPADTGKPTAKLDKYQIRDGCCYWENPIFETVKFNQDPKTGKINDRIYHCTISTGSSKSNILGEVSVNMAEYAGAAKAVSVSFPLKGSNSDVALHVLIQRIQENVNQREIEEHEGAKIKPENKTLVKNITNGGTEDNINIDSTDKEHLKKMVANIAELNDNRSASIGSDITVSSTDSSSGLYTPQELGITGNNMLPDSITHNKQRTQWNLLEAPGHGSTTDDSANSSNDTFPNGRSQFSLDHSTEKLKTYLVLLSRKAEMSDLELQTLRKQIVKERKRGQELLKEVACLKVDRDDLKEECKKLKASQKGKDESNTFNRLTFNGDPWTLLEETRQELTCVKDLNVSLQIQLKKIQGSKLEERYLQGKVLSDDDDEEQKALEEIVKQHSDAKETYVLEQRVMDLSSEIEMYRRDKDELEMQMEQLALDYEILKQENHDLFHKLDNSHMQEQLKLQYQCSGSYHTANELEYQLNELQREIKEQPIGLTDSLSSFKLYENHVHDSEHELEKQAQGLKDALEVVPHLEVTRESQTICAEEALRLDKLKLENQIKKIEVDLKHKCKEHLSALATIKELEDQIQSLGKEIDKQAEGFESDLEALIRAKVEQEHRAIRAEEDLRLTRLRNANAAGRIQDEFKRLYLQLQSTFNTNEKVASKAMAEASELRLMNNHLQELLQQATEELQSLKSDYEAQVYDLNNKVTLKSCQIEEMFNQLNHQIEQEDEICQSLSEELLLRRAEVDRLTLDIASLSQGRDLKAEVEQVNALVKKRDLLVWMERMKRKTLVFAVDSVNKEAEKSLEELNPIRFFKNEKDICFLNLQSEVNTVKAHCEELRHSLYNDKLEKDKLRKEVILLEAELGKDDALTTMERKLKDNDGQAEPAEREKAGSDVSTAEVAACVSVEATSLKDKIKVLEGLIKQKEKALETSARAFSEKEKDLHDKIEELERRFQELNNCGTTCIESERRKVDGKLDGLDLHVDSYKRVDSMIETSANSIKDNGTDMSTSTMNSGDEYRLYNLLKEMASLREKNTSMENELKEMQDRYLEMSVNFAEVEGERQMLIMTLRSMKNVRKI
ncbi:hypothetical protein V2J09_000592 [Rumex salicifolius]